MNMQKAIVALALAVSWRCAVATEVSPDQAASAALSWLGRSPQNAVANAGGGARCASVVAVRTFGNGSGSALFHVVETSGGGFVVTSGDTSQTPIVAFSGDGAFDASEGSPLYDLLCADLPLRIGSAEAERKWVELSRDEAKPRSANSAGEGLDSVIDVRVGQMTFSKWSQDCLGSYHAFDLYTPKNYPSGCVISSISQIMRYWKFPTSNVRPASCRCWVDGVGGTYSMMGGVYDWDNMPLSADELAEDGRDAQLHELGRLAYDLGVASHMYWAQASGTFGVAAAETLRERFGYAMVRTFHPSPALSGKNIMSVESFRNAILGSLDARMPVSIGILSSSALGHQAVVDGYGFNGGSGVYCHLNFGWQGAYDVWYDLISDDMVPGFLFSVIDDVLYNIHPTLGGDVISGRVLDESGHPVGDVTVNLATAKGQAVDSVVSDERGIFAVRFTGKGTFVLSAEDSSLGRAKRKVVIDKEGENVVGEWDSGGSWRYLIDLDKTGVVANRWKEDLVLSASADPDPDPDPEPDPAPGGETPFAANAAAVFDGWLERGGGVAGTVLVKVGKANAKTHVSKLTATVVMMETTKKLAYKGEMGADGKAKLTCRGRPDMDIFLGEKALSGSLGSAYAVVGARNRFLSKDKSEVKEANEELAPYLGAVNAAWRDGDGWSGLAAGVSQKGKVKVSAFFSDGTKVSATAQFVLGDGWTIPVVNAKKRAFAVALREDASGKVEVSGIPDAVAGAPEPLRAGSAFLVDKGAHLWGKLPGSVLPDVLPNGVAVTQSGAKWILPKAGKVVYKRGTTEVDPDKTLDNPAALKLSYKAKDGSFSGSFKAYANNGGRLKATTVNVTGVVVGSVGYGTASVKKTGCAPVRVALDGLD